MLRASSSEKKLGKIMKSALQISDCQITYYINKYEE